MMDLKTGKEDPDLLGQISIDSDFITKSGFFLEAFGRYIVKAYQAACKIRKKVRVILEYDPAKKKSCISIRFDEQRNLSNRCQQSECSRRFCEMLLKKCKNGSNLSGAMGARNEWVRMLSRLEKIGDLPDISMMEKIAEAFEESLKEFIKANGRLMGSEVTYLISDGIRNYCNLKGIVDRMKNQDISHS